MLKTTNIESFTLTMSYIKEYTTDLFNNVYFILAAFENICRESVKLNPQIFYKIQSQLKWRCWTFHVDIVFQVE